MSISNRLKINVLFSIALGLSAFVSYTSYRNADLLKENSFWVVHTYQVGEGVDRISSLLKDLETGQRGYLITGRETYLEPYSRAREEIDGKLLLLKSLVSDNPAQLARAQQMQELKEARVLLMEETIRARRTKGFEAAREIVETGQGKRLMDRMRVLGEEMRTVENDLLRERSAAAEQSTANTFLVILLGGGLGALLILASVLMINVSELRREKSDRLLARKNEVRSGLLQLSEAMAGELTVNAFAEQVMRLLAEITKSPIGALYSAEGTKFLKRVGGFALPLDGSVPRQFGIGEGLVGQAAALAKPMVVREVPKDYFHVLSGVGEKAPSALYYFPLKFNDELIGVIELGTFESLSETAIEFLESSLSSISVSLNSANVRAQVAELLHRTQVQAEELQAQQEELKSFNEELQTQQEELTQANEELQEQRSALEEKTEILEQNNIQLERTRLDLIDKAEELETASGYKSEFLANMSHELRTPLNSILLLSRYLTEQENLTDSQLESANAIYSSGADLLNLISDILDLSKVEAGKLEVTMVEFPLTGVADSLRKIFQNQFKEKGLAFEVSIDARCPALFSSDQFRLEQVLKNFISNAIKFTTAGSVTLSISPTSDGQSIRFAVTDTGVGIAEPVQERIFAAFEQADGSITRKYGGSGLGLAISRELASLLGGSVQLEKSTPAGSTFSLTLPIRKAEAEKTSVLRETAAPVSVVPAAVFPKVEDDREALRDGDRKILIIEDDPGFAKVLAGLCKARGFKALIALSGEAGISDAKKHHPDAVLLDLKLPGVSGITVLASLKENLRTRHIPIHVISGRDETKEVMRMGAVGLLHKPVDQAAIESTLKGLEEKLANKEKTILVVEDKKIEREAIRKLIGDDDVHTVGAGSGAEAIELLKQNKYDCMVLDLQLPDMTGFDLLAQMAKDKAHVMPPVIVYTGRDLSKQELEQLRLLSETIIIKGARSEERLLDEITLFLHRVSTDLPMEKQQMLERVRHREEVFEGKRVLVVDDDMRNIFALRSVLQDRGLTILVAKTGVEALTRLDENPDVDIVLMDIMMPEMNGLEATERIRMQSRFKSLPVIALTAKAMTGDKEKCLAAGANDYLSKPIDSDNLLSILRIWLMRKTG